MDAILLLDQQHQDAKKALQQILGIQDVQATLKLWEVLQSQLEAHEQIEQQLLYQPLTEFCGSDSVLAAWDREHQSEVAQLKADIQSLGAMGPSSMNWREQLQSISDAVSNHIDEEENRAFPFITLVWRSTRRQSAGLAMEKYLQEGPGAS